MTSCLRRLINLTEGSIKSEKLSERTMHWDFQSINVNDISVNPSDSCAGSSIPNEISMSLTFEGGWLCSQLACIMGSDTRSMATCTSSRPIACQRRLRISCSNGDTGKGGAD